MREKLEDFLKSYIRNQAGGQDDFRMDEDGLYAHLDLSSTDGDGLYLQDGYTLRLSKAELEQAKQLMAQAMGRMPTDDQFEAALRPMVTRLLKETHQGTENCFLLGFFAVIIAIVAVVLSRLHIGFLPGGLALAALLGMELLPPEKKRAKVWENVLLLIFVGSILWAILALQNK